MNDIIKHFRISGKPVKCINFGEGNINDTYKVDCDNGSRYILQRINHKVFHHPDEVMANISAVTGFISDKGVSRREVLHYLKSDEGNYFYFNGETWWRMYEFVPDSVSYRMAKDRDIFKESARCFGHFMNQLSNFPAEKLYYTIPDFHNTPKRYEYFKKIAYEDKFNRKEGVCEDIDFLLQRENQAGILIKMLEKNELPLRVTHNDTKLDNVLFDETTDKAICIIDLDTVMPGLSVIDFGDAVRSGAATASEDETELNKIHIDLDYFDAYVDGYLSECGSSLTENEKEQLTLGVWTITLELGLRFLTDYLEGDVYFKTQHPGHNLDRWKAQRALVEDIESNYNKMIEIVKKYC